MSGFSGTLHPIALPWMHGKRLSGIRGISKLQTRTLPQAGKVGVIGGYGSFKFGRKMMPCQINSDYFNHIKTWDY
jgi:hypothetical protein